MIWLTEVAPKRDATKKFLTHLDAANAQANPGLSGVALTPPPARSLLVTGVGRLGVLGDLSPVLA